MEGRKIAIKDFYGEGEHVYELGWRELQRQEAKSSVST